jgi:hypothetical protein
MKTAFSPVLIFVLAWSTYAQTRGSTEDEVARINQTALDYVEGWYAADVDRMESALHPDLVERRVVSLPNGTDYIDSTLMMVEVTRVRTCKKSPTEPTLNEIEILDVCENAATAKAISADFVAYLHLAKCGGKWKIVNVLRTNTKE